MKWGGREGGREEEEARIRSGTRHGSILRGGGGGGGGGGGMG
jgi:hypothetical protein